MYVFVPAHAGLADTTGAEGVIAFPQLSMIAGGVGATASEGHATVDAPLAGITTTGAAMVYI